MKNYYKAIVSRLGELNNEKFIEVGKENDISIKKEIGKFGLTCEFIEENKVQKSIIQIDDILIEDEKKLNYYSKYVQLQLKKLIGEITNRTKILVVGMGNSFITADSLGTRIAENLEPTRHLKGKTEFENVPSLSIFLPSVLGITGIESADSINAICDIVKPNVIIAIDSLCASHISRFCSTIQFSSDGITPGAGIGNNRKKINRASVGAKVIAVGVPLLIKSTASGFSSSAIELKDFQTIFTCADIKNVVEKFAKIISNAISKLVLN